MINQAQISSYQTQQQQARMRKYGPTDTFEYNGYKFKFQPEHPDIKTACLELGIPLDQLGRK